MIIGAAIVVFAVSWLERAGRMADPLAREIDQVIGWGSLILALVLMLEGLWKFGQFGTGLTIGRLARLKKKPAFGVAGPASSKETMIALGDTTRRPPPPEFVE
jgi:hypothetical protein